MSTRLFIIPWLCLIPLVQSQQTPNNGYMGATFYDLVQRQNQFNNALLLNNALLTNSMNANLRESQLQHGLPFATGLTGLPVPLTHLEQLLKQHSLPSVRDDRLGIYDAMSGPAASIPNSQAPQPAPVAAARGVARYDPEASDKDEGEADTLSPVVYSTAQIKQKLIPIKDLGQTAPSTAIHIKSIKKSPVEKVNENEANKEKEKELETDESEQEKVMEKNQEETTTLSTTAETRTTQLATLAPTTSAPVMDVFSLLRQLNLTETETDSLVRHVEQVVREELAKKLIETKLASLTLSPTKKDSVDSTTTSTTAEPSTTPPITSAESITETPSTSSLENSSSVPFEETTMAEDELEEPEMHEIKHHPPRREHDKDLLYPAGPIKTSETHIPLIGRTGDEESGERDLGGVDLLTAEAEPLVPPKPRKETELKKTKLITRRPYLESDTDLLDLATGAPLDLTEEDKSEEALYRSRSSAKTTPAPVPSTAPYNAVRPLPRARSTHVPTAFEHLASDYRERLTGTGDINKIMKKFYENAYIQLVSDGSPQKRAPRPGHPIKRTNSRYA